MKKVLRFFNLAVAAVCALAASAQTETPVNHNLYKVKVGPFEELRIVSPINVNYVASADSAGMAVFECDPALAPVIMFNNKKGELSVEVSEGAKDKALPTVTVYSRFLNKATNLADSTLRLVKVAEGPRISLTQEKNGALIAPALKIAEVHATQRLGKGSLTIGGEAERGKFTLIGPGLLDAVELKTGESSIKVGGNGIVKVWAVNKLDLLGAGSTTVYYRDAKEFKNRSVGTTLIRIEENDL